MSARHSTFLLPSTTLMVALWSAACGASVDSGEDSATKSSKPNILVILADDLGYADVGFQGCKDIPTPNLDALAKSGVRCTNGYVTHPFCSPTRAGLLTGRYQQRFGHENNPQWLPDNPRVGLPVSQYTLPQALKTVDYVTGCVGKWHLGAHPVFHPNRRGFDEYFGLLGGGHVYLPDVKGGVEYTIPMNRNGRDEPLTGYLTEVLGHEAAAFVQKHKSEPWFLYLAFNAPHTPLQATKALVDRVKGIEDETRRNYAALVVSLDDAVGEVRRKLRESGQEENTLVFFFSDNGGPTAVTHSDNRPLRGIKGELYDGGIHVPFVVSWPAVLPMNQTYDQPVSSLDVFETAAAVTGARVPQSHPLDGTNIIPYLRGDKKGSPHETLFWRTGGGNAWAVRDGAQKLVKIGKNNHQLFHLAADVGETKDLATAEPETVARLNAVLERWNSELIPPIFENPPGPAKRRKATK